MKEGKQFFFEKKNQKAFAYGGVLNRDATCWIAAALGIAALCAIFAPEISSAVSVWNSSTAYGHCWLVLPIVAWLLWERRQVPAGHPARPLPWAALLALPLVLIWIAADLLGIMEGRQLASIGFVLVLLMAALGWRLWWALSAAFLYLIFLVPFGAFLTQPLQHFTAHFIGVGLDLLDIPYDANSFQIAIPEGVFYVAEACAGLRFLIASVAFGVLYAVTMFRSPWRRAGFIAVACVVPVVANGFRALGIVLLGHTLGSAEAGAADHLIYGWVFFSAVIVALALAGLPFREAPAAPQEAAPIATAARISPLHAALACIPVLALALAGLLLTGGAPAHPVAAPEVPTPSGCTAGVSHVSADGVAEAAFRCGTSDVRITTAAFAPGTNPMRVIEAARQPALDGLGTEVSGETWTTPYNPQATWIISRARDTGRLSAYAILIDGKPSTGGLHDRWNLARTMFTHINLRPTVAQSVVMQNGTGDALKAMLIELSHVRRPSPS